MLFNPQGPSVSFPLFGLLGRKMAKYFETVANVYPGQQYVAVLCYGQTEAFFVSALSQASQPTQVNWVLVVSHLYFLRLCFISSVFFFFLLLCLQTSDWKSSILSKTGPNLNFTIKVYHLYKINQCFSRNIDAHFQFQLLEVWSMTIANSRPGRAA